MAAITAEQRRNGHLESVTGGNYQTSTTDKVFCVRTPSAPFSVLELAYVPESHLHAVLNVDLTDANASMMSALFYTLECVCAGKGRKNGQ